ncbi:MAG: tetratricopeptide repeat protein [Anditalea sp.]
MKIRSKKSSKILWGILFLFILSTSDVYPQFKLTKKERKLQDREAKADRLFIEGQRFLMIEEYDKAYFYFSKALEYKPESGAINYKIAEILARANKNNEALEYGQKAIKADPENKYYHLLIAEVYSKQKKPQKAAEVLNSLMENSDDNQQYILELASLYLTSKEYDKALDALEKAEDYYGIVAQLTFQKQKIYLQKNDLENAVKEGLRLIEARPGHSQYVLSLVEILFNNGKIDKALEVVLKSLDTYPNQPDLHLATYTLYKEKGSMETALEYLIQAFSNPDLAGAAKAKAYSDILREMKSQKRDSLLTQLGQLMLDHHPNDPSVYTILGNKELFSQNKKKALGYYKKSLELNPANEEVMQGTITLMFELRENFADIEQYTVMAIEEFPDKAEFWFFDGTSKLSLKKYQAAETSLLKALELNKGRNKQLDILAGGQLGDTYHSLKKKEEAYKAYEKVLVLSPDNEHILNNYAYFLSLDKKDLAKAKKMSEKLVLKFPKNATYLDTHAWVLFQLQDYEDARLFMKEALENQTHPSGIMYEHYGDILFKLGNKKEAWDYWKKAERLEDVSDLLDKKIKNQQYYE